MGFSEHYFVDDYRFGFNGMEKDDEVAQLFWNQLYI